MEAMDEPERYREHVLPRELDIAFTPEQLALRALIDSMDKPQPVQTQEAA